MKTRTINTLGALTLALILSSCTSPLSGNDPFRRAMGYGMQGQMAAHQQASALMAAGQSPRRLSGMRTIPLVPVAEISPYAQ
jgi:hypothetical protein